MPGLVRAGGEESTERACAAAGWEFVRVGEPDPGMMANTRWLSRYRRRRCLRPEVAERLLEVFDGPVPPGSRTSPSAARPRLAHGRRVRLHRRLGVGAHRPTCPRTG
ncbi:hypothetical protein BU198_28435 [Streptomyces sp. CBMA156]|nr:hypothetical protein [Streptomyces sp. CBMA156]MBD0674528.1 hypothetical protein [Streptomyces sp. CBMA156]